MAAESRSSGVQPSAATQALSSAPREYVVRRFRLEVTGGPDAGKSAEASGDEITVGTASGNGLVLTDPTVSRQHFAVTATPEGFSLSDLGSKNGTLVGALRVERAWIKPGTTISIGLSTVRFDPLSEAIREPLSIDERFGRILGRSAAMRRIFALVPRIAGSDATVLLEGETGTGKSLVGEAIHHASARKDGPFVVVDCGAIAPSLIESELFGHEKGSFTGATATRVGAFEAASGGTVLVDEIGELPLDLQPKLLRAIETKEIKRVGGRDSIKVDMRILAATHRDLREAVNRGSFRADLYYRTAVVAVRIPPLRERREDIPLLVDHFQEQLARPDEPRLPANVVEDFAQRSWPGNVRELRGAVERALLLGDPSSPPLQSTDGPANEATDLPFRLAKEQAVSAWERRYLAALVARSGGNLSKAARSGRMDRNHLRELLRRHGLATQSE